MSAAITTRKPRGQGASRRGEVLAAAKRLFLEEGYEHATMRRIAAEVGVSAAALYGYFPDKEAILRAIAEVTFSELLVRLEESQRGDALPLERFKAGLRAYVAFGLARPDEYRLTFLAKMITPERRADACPDGIDAADRSFAILERGITELMDAGVFAPGDTVAVAEAMWACLHGTTALLLDHPDHLQTSPDQLVEAVIAMMLGGLTR
ncbi:MAG: TetR/AcrR family transcriptional regulator [Acetobacteraceae bacterium]|nr:TetR/AcrR family transcriptional regulator [Acetobacteraceae bacterium]